MARTLLSKHRCKAPANPPANRRECIVTVRLPIQYHLHFCLPLTVWLHIANHRVTKAQEGSSKASGLSGGWEFPVQMCANKFANSTAEGCSTMSRPDILASKCRSDFQHKIGLNFSCFCWLGKYIFPSGPAVRRQPFVGARGDGIQKRHHIRLTSGTSQGGGRPGLLRAQRLRKERSS